MPEDTIEARAQTVSPAEAAHRLGLSPRTLSNLRLRHAGSAGPPYVKALGRVRYRVVDLAIWLDSRVHVPGADRGVPSDGQHNTQRKP
jgi:hypothetical protein